jgi:Glycosyltransferase family 87
LRVSIGTAGALLFWCAVLVLQQLNWGLGVWRAILLVAFLLSVPLLLIFGVASAPRPSGRVPKALVGAGVLVILAQIVFFGVRVANPHLVDMATTTMSSSRAILNGQNPYVLAIDTGSPLAAETGFSGYKYLPMMALGYLPLTEALGSRGLLIMNLLLQFAVAGLLLRLGQRMATTESGVLAAVVYLALPLVAMQVLAKGSTDLMTVAPLLLALLLLEQSPAAAGLCVGLSIASKLTPGLLFVPCLMPATRTERTRYALGLVVGWAPVLFFAFLSPAAFFKNILLFNLIRSPDSTSVLAMAPSGAAWFARGIFLVFAVAVTAYVARKAPTLRVHCGLGVILTLGAILCGPGAHQNYQLWWLPFYSLLVALALTGVRPSAAVDDLGYPRPELLRKPCSGTALSGLCKPKPAS